MKICALAPHYTLDELVKIKNKSSDNGQKLRLRAIINIGKGKTLSQTAEDLLTSRRSVGIWYLKYNENGTEGLLSNKGGRKEGNPKWDSEIFEKLIEHLKNTGGYWSVPKMQEWIKETFKKTIPQQTIWYHLIIKKFSYKSSRPHPYKGDKEQQESFKKRALSRR
jgi:transposase